MTTTLIDDIETSRDGATQIIRFARPAKKNALTLAMYERMNAALAEAAADKSVKAVVFSSTSETFTAGNDLGDFMQNPPQDESAPVFRFIRALAAFEKPIVAAVDGKAVGLGFTMLLHCDFVYVTERAALTTPFVNLGLVPEAASSLILPALVGHRVASEILILGEAVSGTRAAQLGIANAVVEPGKVEAKALEIARVLGEKPPTALKLTKALLRDTKVLHERMSIEGDLFVKQLASPELAEAISAFFEKRKPDFSKV